MFVKQSLRVFIRCRFLLFLFSLLGVYVLTKRALLLEHTFEASKGREWIDSTNVYGASWPRLPLS